MSPQQLITSLASRSPGSRANGLVEKIGLGFLIYEGAKMLTQAYREVRDNKFSYTVSVKEQDPLYEDVYEWLIATLPNERYRALSVTTRRMWRSEDDMGERRPTGLSLRHNEKTERRMVIDGHPITLHLEVPELREPGSLRQTTNQSTITFTSRTYAGQQAVVRQIQKLYEKRTEEWRAKLQLVGQWGSWTTRSDLPPRTMDSVILPKEQKTRIVEDLREFLASEETYNRLAIPWHRGYMFHGPPGTGKTSFVKALANEFNLDLWYISLSDMKDESTLIGLISEVGPRSLLLLEDIDTVRITHDRDSSNAGTISMSSLLNTLDGVATPHGLITMMTTNRFEVLDPALTRAGRMDVIEKLDYPTVETLGALYKYYYDKELPWLSEYDGQMKLEGRSTSEISEILKRHMSNPRGAAKELRNLMSVRV